MATTTSDIIPLIRDIQSPAEMKRFIDYLRRETMLVIGINEFMVPVVKIQIGTMAEEIFDFHCLRDIAINVNLNVSQFRKVLDGLHSLLDDATQEWTKAVTKETAEEIERQKNA